eukprot:13798835-Ditylum_brightwellii.AAC.1
MLHTHGITILHSSLKTVLNMSYSMLAGTSGGLNIMLTKTIFFLFVGQVNDKGLIGLFTSPLLYAMAFFLVLTYMLQMGLVVVVLVRLDLTFHGGRSTSAEIFT